MVSDFIEEHSGYLRLSQDELEMARDYNYMTPVSPMKQESFLNMEQPGKATGLVRSS